MLPDGITIFGFKIYFYGILIMLGALAATWIAAARAKQYGEDGDMAWDILPWALVGGIIGARLWHIILPPASMLNPDGSNPYINHPLDIFNLRNGGLGIPGAVIGGFIAVYFYTRNKERSILTWADMVAPGLALAQGIGRWGNFFNQELYGLPTNLPWKLYIPPEKRVPAFANDSYYHPLFLYEFIWDVLNAGVLIWLSRRFKDRLKRGDLFLIYLVIYGVGRFLLEFLRLDPAPVAGINFNQTFMGVTALVAAVILVVRHRMGGPEPVAQPAGELAGVGGIDEDPTDPEQPEDEVRNAELGTQSSSKPVEEENS